MRKVVFISCVSKKRNHKTRAEELYISDLFKKNLAYAKSLKPDVIYIMSAKYGLLSLNDAIEPYEQTLNTMADKDVRIWAAGVLEQLRDKVDFVNDKAMFLAGERYRKYLTPHFKNISVPMQGFRIGEQLAFLKHAIAK